MWNYEMCLQNLGKNISCLIIFFQNNLFFFLLYNHGFGDAHSK